MLQTLGRLGVQWDRRTRGMRVPRDLYGNLLSVSRLGWLCLGWLWLGGHGQSLGHAAAQRLVEPLATCSPL